MTLLAALLLGLQGTRDLDPRVLEKGAAKPFEEAEAGLRAANDRESKAWAAIRTREDWESYRDAKLAALRASLGTFPAGPLNVRVGKTIEAEGCRIEALVYESRPGVLVAANLYAPAAPSSSMPCLVIVHSHHAPKTQGELQDMGRIWARAGGLVLVPDLPGHGERRAHPFKDAASFPAPFKPSRQDYWFRYVSAAQLHLAGESLTGLIAGDLRRGIDVLLARPGADPTRIAILGAVAGGGDPAAVAAALDPRVAAVVPFNFGGPQPETRYPLPEDASTSFAYAGGGSWESTRNLRLSARDGFLPWVIVGSVAPRGLVHAHEFAWDRERDPVWARYRKIFGFYGKPERLAFAHGRGSVRSSKPDDTHCTNIGAEHRKSGIYAAFETWLGLPVPAKENAERLPAEALLTGLPIPPLHEVLPTPPAADDLRGAWARILGGVEPLELKPGEPRREGNVERLLLGHVPLLVFRPAAEGRRPAVLGVAQDGKAGFLKHRAVEIDALLAGGAIVCLADLRATGELSAGGLGRTGGTTSLSATEQMLGRTLPGLRVRELRAVLAWLRGREDVDASRLALWGDSFAAPHPAGAAVEVPWDAPSFPALGHPAGAMAVLLAALYEPELRAVWARGGLDRDASILKSPCLLVPHDAIVPGALAAGDWPAVEAALRMPLRREGRIDGLNRAVGASTSDAASAWLLERLAPKSK